MRTFPKDINVTGARGPMLDLFSEYREQIQTYVEVGCHKGYTAHHVIKRMRPGGRVILLDFDVFESEIQQNVGSALYENPTVRAEFIGNSEATFDSYNWGLSRMIDQGVKIDFAFIDGAHTLHHDGLAFCLVDVMLQPGGIVYMDDWDWSFATSKTCNYTKWPEVNQMYTVEQQKDFQVQRVVRQLIRTNPNYEEIVENFAFRKRS